jgi:hypothetical protein
MPPLVVETLTLGPWQSSAWEFHLHQGDVVRGLVDERDGDWLKIYLLDQQNYVRMKNRLRFNYWGGVGIGAYRYDLRIPTTGRYYLVVGHNDWWGRPEVIRVNLSYHRTSFY